MTTGKTSLAGIHAAVTPTVSPGFTTQAGLAIARYGTSTARSTQVSIQSAYGPPASKIAQGTQVAIQTAGSAGATNVTAKTTQAAIQIAYASGTPGISRLDSWTFVLDGHRFYVLPLGPEGDWAYDTTTQEWCQLQTQGYNGINLGHGVMWDERIMGSNLLDPILIEMDPNATLDDDFRPVEHIVTGGVSTRGRHSIGVANFTLTASVGDDQSTAIPITLAFSDDNGVTWSKEFAIPLTDAGSQLLIWNALGSFAAPGRVFRVTDFAGPVRLDGADVVLTVGTGADSGVSDPE